MKPEQVLRGTWRITATENRRRKALGARQPARIAFGPRNRGSLRLLSVDCKLDCRCGEREGHPSVAFSFAGTDQGDTVSGRGVAAVVDGRLHGHLFFHLGGECSFAAERVAARRPRRLPARRKGR
ncbi:MAG: hypothetical protein EYC70_12665 [Planctomycetota bacterium]|nr:MAG: hypothetical protein EYC70_12665 [Planctomycetota bacterium]